MTSALVDVAVRTYVRRLSAVPALPGNANQPRPEGLFATVLFQSSRPEGTPMDVLLPQAGSRTTAVLELWHPDLDPPGRLYGWTDTLTLVYPVNLPPAERTRWEAVEQGGRTLALHRFPVQIPVQTIENGYDPLFDDIASGSNTAAQATTQIRLLSSSGPSGATVQERLVGPVVAGRADYLGQQPVVRSVLTYSVQFHGVGSSEAAQRFKTRADSGLHDLGAGLVYQSASDIIRVDEVLSGATHERASLELRLQRDERVSVDIDEVASASVIANINGADEPTITVPPQE